MYDLVFRGARIADGLGHPLIEGDLAVADGRVAAIGRIWDGAAETVDAKGLVLAPGVIDLHTHYDAQLTWDKTASPSPALGVTTVVIGNCGFGIAPTPAHRRDTVLANLSEVEAMSLDALRAGVDWGFESFGEYLDLLRRKSVYPNVAVLASHTVMRTAVMGDEASERPSTAAELEQMLGLFREAMDAGAIGLGSSTNENHRGFGGIPIASRMASEDEFRAFMRLLADYPHGAFMATCGYHTTIDFLEELATISGRPALYAPVVHYSNDPGRAPGILAACDAARARGVPVYAQASCQPLSLSFSLASAYILKTIDPWPADGTPDQLKPIFADPGFRQAIRETLARPDPRRIFNGDWSLMDVTTAARPRNAALEGRTITEIAAAQGRDPLDAFLDLALDEDLQTLFTGRILNVEEDRVGDILRNDGALVSLSDAGAHNTFLCDAGYAMYLFGRWVRELRALDLPTAIRKVTSDPADVYGILDRGRLVPGAQADMILFDPETIGITKMERHRDMPAGGERLLRRAPGLHGTWVNGVRVFDGTDYVAHAKGPGEVLTRFKPGMPTLAMPDAKG
ncbi:MAG TPA: amidohydrolase family protein [Stellaceae bacterium]|nr:amidohydrolase family protein [Stellaceae bacterium]